MPTFPIQVCSLEIDPALKENSLIYINMAETIFFFNFVKTGDRCRPSGPLV